MKSTAEILSPREAALKGQGLHDRTEEGLFELARRRSIPGARGFEIVEGDRDLRSPLFDGHSLPGLLTELARKKLVLPLPEIQFQDNRLIVVSKCFVRSGPIEILDFMYADAVKRSAYSVLCWLDTIDDLPARVAAELGISDVSDETLTEAATGTPAFLRPLELLRSFDYVVTPEPGILKDFALNITKHLLEARRYVLVDDDILFPVIQNDVEKCFETAGEALIRDAAVISNHNSNLSRYLKRVDVAEAKFFRDPKSVPTARFLKRKAAVVEAAIGPDHPIPLSARLIRALHRTAEQAYRAWAEALDQGTVEEFARGLFHHSDNWKNMIRVVDSDERAGIRIQVWTALLQHPDLFWVRYERPHDTIYIFIPRSRQILQTLISGMLHLKSRERWQITALKELIESNEAFWARVIARPDIIPLYEELLRKAYMDFLPWYARALLYLHIQKIETKLFAHAKLALAAEQKNLSRTNSKANSKSPRSRKGREVFNRRIVATSKALERSYFAERTVPSVKEIARATGETDLRTFRNFLESSGFRILAVGKFEESVLFFPEDDDYRKRLRDLHRSWPGILLSLTESNPGAATLRALRLQNYFGLPTSPSTEKILVPEKSAP